MKNPDPIIDGKQVNIVFCPILKTSLCYNCKKGEKFKMISAAYAFHKYKVDKDSLDKLNLKYMLAPNPWCFT